MNKRQTPAFYSILTARVRYHTKLSDKAKLFFSEINALSNKDGFCSASNEYFMKHYECTLRTVQRMIKELADEDLIRIDWTIKDGRRDKRRLFVNINSRHYPSRKEKKEETTKKVKRQKCRKVDDKNVVPIIKNNTTSINKDMSESSQSDDTLFRDENEKQSDSKKKESRRSKFYEKKARSLKINIPKLYTESVEKYDKFMKSKNLVARLDAGEGKAMKLIIAYFIDLILVNAEEVEDDISQDWMKSQVLLAFDHLFFNWNKLEAFHQKQVKLKQINSNLINIINSIKNGTTKQSTNQKRRERSVWDSSFDDLDIIEHLER